MPANERKILTTISIDGAAEFKKSLDAAYNGLKVLGSEMKLNTAIFGDNAKSMEGLTKKGDILSREIAQQKEIVNALSKAVEDSAQAYGESDKKTDAFRIKLNNATASLNKMEGELNQNQKEIDDFGKEEKIADGKTNELGDEIERTSDKTNKWGNRLKTVSSHLGSGFAKGMHLAAVGITAIATAAVAAGSALVAASVSAASYADDVLTVSTQTGIATDELQKYKYAAELVDVPVETLTKSMAKQIKSMKAAQDGTKLSVDAYKKLGISVKNSDGSLRDSQTVYWEVIDALGKITNETERDAIGMQLLGKSAQELNPLIEAGSEKMKELGKQAEEAGYIMSGETLSAFGKLDDQLQYLKVGASAAKNALGSVLLPVLTTLSTDGVSLLGTFTKGINDANGDIGKMMDVVADTLGAIVEKIIEYLPQIVDSGLKIISAIGGAILDNLPTIIQAASNIITSVISGITTALPHLIDGATLIMSSLSSLIVTNLPLIFDAGAQILVAIVNGLAADPASITQAITTAITSMITTITTNLPLILSSGIDILLAIIKGILDSIPVLIENIPLIITNIVNALKEKWPALVKAGYEAIKAIGRGLWDNRAVIIDTLKKIMQDALENMLDFGIFGKNWMYGGPNTKLPNLNPGYASGLDYVPSEGLYHLHPGEAVLNAKAAQPWRDQQSGYSNRATMPGGEVNLAFNYTVNANETSYSEQRRIAEKSARNLLKELSALNV